jgi:hypothetical protein
VDRADQLIAARAEALPRLALDIAAVGSDRNLRSPVENCYAICPRVYNGVRELVIVMQSVGRRSWSLSRSRSPPGTGRSNWGRGTGFVPLPPTRPRR